MKSDHLRKKINMIYDITEFGAVPDGSLQTEAIQRTIDECGRNGGIVRIPAGRFVSGRLNLRSGITLKLEPDAILAGSSDWHDYKLYPDDPGRWRDYGVFPGTPDEWEHALEVYDTSFLRGVNLRDVTIEGPGVIDGCDCVNPGGEEGFRGPHMCYFGQCVNLNFIGYTVRNAANFAHNLVDCHNIRAFEVKVEAGHDGFHMRRCENILIDHCRFHIGDDCVAGTDNVNTVVRDCDFNTSCNGFRFSGANLLVERCHFHGPGIHPHRVSGRHNMLAVFNYFTPDGRKPQVVSDNWKIRHCRIENVECLFSYNGRGEYSWHCAQPLLNVEFEHVDISGLKCTSWIFGRAPYPIDLAFTHVCVAFAETAKAVPFLTLSHATCVMKDVTPGLRIETDCRDGICSDDPGMEIVLTNFDQILPPYY